MKRIDHPEFVAPASLAIFGGVLSGVFALITKGGTCEMWTFGFVLAITGVLQLRRHRTGTALMAILLAGGLYYGIRQFELSAYGVTKFGLGLVCIGGVLHSLIEQVRYFKEQDAHAEPAAN